MYEKFIFKHFNKEWWTEHSIWFKLRLFLKCLKNEEIHDVQSDCIFTSPILKWSEKQKQIFMDFLMLQILEILRERDDYYKSKEYDLNEKDLEDYEKEDLMYEIIKLNPHFDKFGFMKDEEFKFPLRD